jgi:outer membrane immunogenic protein
MNCFPRLICLLILCALPVSKGAQSGPTGRDESQVTTATARNGLTSWTGFYLGADFGDASDAFDFGDGSEAFATTGFMAKAPLGSSHGDSSYLAGGQIGYNHQFGKIVIGLEWDADWVSLEGSRHSDFFFFNNPPPFNFALLNTNRTAQLDFVSTLRARTGFSWRSLLFYATGGLALGDLTVNARDFSSVEGPMGPIQQVGSGSDSGIAIGWAAGAGLEWSINRTVSIAAEYQHLDIGGNYNPTSNQQLFNAKSHIDFSDDEVTLRVNVHLSAFFRR